MSSITEAQKQLARQWLEAGLKLAEFQKKVEAEFGLKLTYMETRLLVDDLKVMPKDPEPSPEPVIAAKPSPPTEPAAPADTIGGSSKLAVSVDTVTQPGVAVSGKVTFSDGKKAMWYVDQYGRPGLVPEEKGYRPSREDLQEFQLALDRELTRMGM